MSNKLFTILAFGPFIMTLLEVLLPLAVLIILLPLGYGVFWLGNLSRKPVPTWKGPIWNLAEISEEPDRNQEPIRIVAKMSPARPEYSWATVRTTGSFPAASTALVAHEAGAFLSQAEPELSDPSASSEQEC